MHARLGNCKILDGDQWFKKKKKNCCWKSKKRIMILVGVFCHLVILKFWALTQLASLMKDFAICACFMKDWNVHCIPGKGDSEKLWDPHTFYKLLMQWATNWRILQCNILKNKIYYGGVEAYFWCLFSQVVPV